MAQPLFGDNPVIKPTGKPAFGDNPVAAQTAPAPLKEPSLAEYIMDTIGGNLAGVANLGADIVASPVDMLSMMDQSEQDARRIRAATPEADRSWYNKTVTELLGASPETEQAITGFREGVFDTTAEAKKTIDELYEPKYGAGKFAKAAIPWVAPSLVPSKAARFKQGIEKLPIMFGDFLTQGAIPWAAYEGAKYTTDSPAAGLLASLVAALGGGVTRNINTPEAQAGRDYSGTKAKDWEAGIALQKLQENYGQYISPGETMAQVTNQPQHPGLTRQRSDEATIAGQEIAGPIMAKRGEQVKQVAREHVLDPLSPKSVAPQTLGSQVAKGAQQAIVKTGQERTAAASPHYQRANQTLVEQGDMDAVLAEIDAEIAKHTVPDVKDPLVQFRADLIAQGATPGTPAARVEGGAPGIRRHVPAVPGTPEQPALDVDNIDSARQKWRDVIGKKDVSEGAINAKARHTIAPFLDRVDQILEKNPDFVKGKEEYTRLTEGLVDPTVQGATGEMARAKTTEDVGSVLFPNKPKANDIDDIVDAVMRVTPETTAIPPAARQRLDQIIKEKSGNTRSNTSELLGGDIAKVLAGDPDTRARTKATLTAMGKGSVADRLDEILEGWLAMGKRLPPNSATAANIQRSAELSTTAGTTAARAVATKGLGPFIDLLQESLLRANQKRSAQYSFGSVEGMRQAAAKSWENWLPEVATKSGLGALYTYGNEENR